MCIFLGIQLRLRRLVEKRIEVRTGAIVTDVQNFGANLLKKKEKKMNELFKVELFNTEKDAACELCYKYGV